MTAFMCRKRHLVFNDITHKYGEWSWYCHICKESLTTAELIIE